MYAAQHGQGQHQLQTSLGDSQSREHVVNNFQDIDTFLESVLVQNPVSLNSELVPSVLSKGLGLTADSSSIGQQGSNDRRQGSGRPWSSVSNGFNVVNLNNMANEASLKGGKPNGHGPADDVHGSKRERPDVGGKNGSNSGPLNMVSSAGGNSGGRLTDQRASPATDGNRVEGHGKTRKIQKQSGGDWSGQKDKKNASKQSDETRKGQPARDSVTLPGGVLKQSEAPAQDRQHKDARNTAYQRAQTNIQMMHANQQQQVAMAAAFAAQVGGGQYQGWGSYGSSYPYYYPGAMFPPSMPYPMQYPPAGSQGRRFSYYPGGYPDEYPPDCQDGDRGAEEHDMKAQKRSRLVWTDKLHQRFLESVEKCGGIDNALPKAIMQDMQVQGLTRENVASHLQKHRMRLKKNFADDKAHSHDIDGKHETSNK